MTKLVWDQVGTRRYETGVDHGVLYVEDQGYAWSGLVSVKEKPVGGDVRAYYIDGIRYANRLTLEEFAATIEAYTYPEAFAACDGTLALGNGLFATQQRRKSFGFSYRTRIGNDVQGLEHGYKIHIVYSATARPASVDRNSLSDSIEPFLFSWEIVTKPPVLDFVPTAHFVIDSRSTPDGLLSQIEDILYGSTMQAPRLPSAGELAFLFSSYEVSNFDAGDPDEVVYYTFDGGGPISDQNTYLDGGTSVANTQEAPEKAVSGGVVDASSSDISDGGGP